MKWTGDSYEVEVLPDGRITVAVTREHLATYQAFQLADALTRAGHHVEINRLRDHASKAT